MTTKKLITPQGRHVYTLAEIEHDLYLQDSAFLRFDHQGHVVTLQDSHCELTELMEQLPGFADTRWVYEQTTSEWIPLFNYADDNAHPITAFVDIEGAIGSNGEVIVGEFYATPKGFPSRQFYADPENRD